MKITFATLLSIYLTITSTSSEAMTAEIYFKIKKLSVGNDTVAQSSDFAIKAYQQGLAEAFGLMAMANSNKLVFSKNTRICLPSSDVLTREIVSSAIDRIIGSLDNPKEISPSAREMPLAIHAFAGLAQIFPCSP